MKKILWIVLVLAVIAGGIGYYLYNKPVQSVAKQEAQFTVTAPQLTGAFQRDQNEATAKYLDQIVAVSGTIEEIIPGEGLQMQIVLVGNDATSNVSCVLEEDHETFLARKLRKGDQISVKGNCTGTIEDMIGRQVIIDPAVIVE